MGKTNSEIQKKFYSLLELTQSIESVIKKTYTKSYWVKAEIAKLNYYPKSGHCYPDLVEKEKGVVRAQIRGTIWAGQFNDINTKFLNITKEPLSDGMTVLIRTSVNFHPVYGMVLQIIDIEPSFTLGEMAKEKILSIEKLKSEGIYYRNKQLVPSLIIQRIAIISIETSKGYQDFLKIIDKNEWDYSFFHMLFPALLQGSGAVKSIKEQLSRIAKVQKNFDAVVIIRGGGGDVGLSSYDNFELAKTVALFPLPIITGIGHATNETVVELVSFANKITPTDVGYYLIQKFHNFSVRLQTAQALLVDKSKKISENEKIRLSNMGRALANKSENVLNFSRYKLMKTSFEFNGISTAFIDKKKHEIGGIEKRLTISIKSTTQSIKLKLANLSEKLTLLDPKNVLRRGYTITKKNGKAIVATDDLIMGDIVETQTFAGQFSSIVKSVKKS